MTTFGVDLSAPRERTAYWLTMAGVAAILLAILWIPAYNTLVDYPFHLARAWALYVYPRSQYFQSLFAESRTPIPNLAIDLIVPPLLHFLPPLAAGKVFLSLIVLLFAAGCHGIATAIYGRPSWTAPLATFAVYNSAFLYGFVNSCFSLSLFLVTLGVWLRVRRKPTVFRWVAVTILATFTYLAHLSGFVFLGFAMGVMTVFEFRTCGLRNIRLIGFLVLLPSVAIQLYPWANKVRLGGDVEWGSLTTKMLGLFSVFLGFRYDLDILALLLLATALILVAVKGKPTLEPSMLCLGVAFLVAGFVCPRQLTEGGGAGADTRFMPPGVVLLFLAFNARVSARTGRIALSLAFAGLLLRGGEIAWALNRSSAAAEAQIAALGHAAPNSRIYALFIRPEDRQEEKRTRANQHLPSYSLILSQSVSSDFYAVRGVEPLYFLKPSDWSGPQSPVALDTAFLDARLAAFDYVWGCNTNAAHRAYLDRHATLVSAADICGLWKITPQSQTTNIESAAK